MGATESRLEHKTLPESPWRHFKNVALLLCVIFAAAGWLYVIYNQHRSNEPVEVVKKHFVFYREYSQGVWREGACAKVDRAKCRDVTYTVPVSGCGPITFDWNVFPDDDGDTTWSYNGTTPKVDESKYPLYAVLNEDSHLIDPPAVGMALPSVCQAR
jgi:hypothetical protein